MAKSLARNRSMLNLDMGFRDLGAVSWEHYGRCREGEHGKFPSICPSQWLANTLLRRWREGVGFIGMPHGQRPGLCMKTRAIFLLGTIILVSLSGCTTYRYRVVQPPGVAAVETQPVRVHVDPLDYTLFARHDRLGMHITNPTDDRILLLGSRSYVIDPQGESHPIRDRALGPHSFTELLLPPIPFSVPYPDYSVYGPGWGWGYTGSWYDPFWGPGLGWWGPPPIAYHRILTVYDWQWKGGPVRLRLAFERNGKNFEHDFEFVKERK
jgi:hypothetical protein